MRGSSRSSLVSARSALDAALKNLGSGAGASSLSSDLFNVVGVLEGSPRLRRALTDPARDGAAKSELITNLMSKTSDVSTVSLLSTMVALRWSSPRDLVDAIESLAVESQAAAANFNGKLDDVEEELFQITQLITNQPSLRQALTDRYTTVEAKLALVDALFGTRITSFTLRLVRALVAAPRGRNIDRGLAEYIKATADRRNRLVARVRTAVLLSTAQLERLSASLSLQVGQPVRLNVDVDPLMMGGLSVNLADEVIDGSIINRLNQARRELVR